MTGVVLAVVKSAVSMTRPKNPALVEHKARLREVIAAILSWQYHFLSIAFNVKRQPL
jgi:hypothetical protein